MDGKDLEEIRRFLQTNRAALRWDPEVRAVAESCGMSIVQSGFYYPIPTLADIAASFEYEEAEPFRNDDLLVPELLMQQLEALIPFAQEFDPPPCGDKDRPQSYSLDLGPFACSDAFAYYAMIRACRPRTILEIGSGASTLIALEAVRRNGFGRLVCIEPFPPTYLKDREDVELIEKPAQAFAPAFFNTMLMDGDILFIDSTHTVKSGSDCVHLYLRILPHLSRSVTVHVHDVFLPQGLPRAWLTEKQVYWAEQYLLMAYLLDNPRTKVIYGSAVNRLKHFDLMSRLNGGKAEIGGGSLWFTLEGKVASP